MKILMYTCVALIAFAGNSVLCRLALGENAIDAASFTVIRLLSGIITLAIILKLTEPHSKPTAGGSWKSSVMLFIYAITFSYSYISLDTGTGALILFASVQFVMILSSLFRGHKLHTLEWLGIVLAFSGFVYLVLPSLGTPSLFGFVLMTVSGGAWAFYTLIGKGSENPLKDTAFNFFRTTPFIVILGVIAWQHANLSPQGIGLAIISGGLASGIGYAIWYQALKGAFDDTGWRSPITGTHHRCHWRCNFR